MYEYIHFIDFVPSIQGIFVHAQYASGMNKLHIRTELTSIHGLCGAATEWRMGSVVNNSWDNFIILVS